MKINKYIVVTFFFTLALMLTSCGTGFNGRRESLPDQNDKGLAAYDEMEKQINHTQTETELAGHYEIKQLTASDNTLRDDELELMRSLGMDVTMDLYEDGNGTLSYLGETEELRYDCDRSIIARCGRECTYHYSNHEFKLMDGESVLLFAKT